MSKQNVPALRLEGFNGEWSEAALGDFGYAAMDKRVFKHQTSPTGDVPFYKIGTFGKSPDSYISWDLYREYTAKYVHPSPGTVLISASGSIGRTVVYDGSPAYFQDSNIIWLEHGEDISDIYLKHFYTVTDWGGIEGTTIKRLYNEQFLKTKIVIPPTLAEQQAIGAIFTNLDTAINQHTLKHKTLQQAKTALMQRMFPQEGQKVPELRLEGFDGEWAAVTVGTVGDVLTGYPFPSDEFVSNGVALIRGMNVKRGYISNAAELTVFWPSTDGLREYELQEDDIILQMDGALIGRSMGMVTSDLLPALLVQRVARVRVRPGYDPYFLFQWFHRDFLQYIRKSKTETAIPHLSALDIRRFLLQVPPTLEEQQAIGVVFTKLDQLIAAEAQYIKALTQAKTALMQRMFV